jgi:hypothetical protein
MTWFWAVCILAMQMCKLNNFLSNKALFIEKATASAVCCTMVYPMRLPQRKVNARLRDKRIGGLSRVRPHGPSRFHPCANGCRCCLARQQRVTPADSGARPEAYPSLARYRRRRALPTRHRARHGIRPLRCAPKPGLSRHLRPCLVVRGEKSREANPQGEF